jgi:hypothetical protein
MMSLRVSGRGGRERCERWCGVMYIMLGLKGLGCEDARRGVRRRGFAFSCLAGD